MSRGKRKLKRSLGRGNEAEEVQTPDFYRYILYLEQLQFIFWTNIFTISIDTIDNSNKYRLGGGNEAEEFQTPDADFDKKCFNVDWNKENNPRLFNIRAKTEDKKY